MRAKFKVDSVVVDNPNQVTIQMSPVSPGTPDAPSPENDTFFSEIPSGNLWIRTTNPDSVAGITVGSEHYIDITPAA